MHYLSEKVRVVPKVSKYTVWIKNVNAYGLEGLQSLITEVWTCDGL